MPIVYPKNVNICNFYSAHGNKSHEHNVVRVKFIMLDAISEYFMTSTSDLKVYSNYAYNVDVKDIPWHTYNVHAPYSKHITLNMSTRHYSTHIMSSMCHTNARAVVGCVGKLRLACADSLEASRQCVHVPWLSVGTSTLERQPREDLQHARHDTVGVVIFTLSATRKAARVHERINDLGFFFTQMSPATRLIDRALSVICKSSKKLSTRLHLIT